MENSISNVNFISSNYSDVTRNLRTKSNNIEIMIGNEIDEKSLMNSLNLFRKIIKNI